MKNSFKLLEPLKVGSHTFKNRMVMAPMESRLSNPDGSSTKEMADYYGERAKGGVAAIILENTFVDEKASRSSLVSSGIANDHMIASKYLVANAIKENGAVAIIQLSHGGRQANPGATGLPCVGPSNIACHVTQRIPHELTVSEIAEIEDAFAEAARRSKQAGFDGVEIHGAHGYLVCSFLSPYTNNRTDQYGGSLENRGLFARNIIAKIRAKVGTDFVVGFRISGSEFVEGGLSIEESTQFITSVQNDIDYVHVSAGNYESMATSMITPLYIPQAPIVHLAAAMKKAVDIPVIAVGALNAELGEKALQEEQADLIGFGRVLLADPNLPDKVKKGCLDDIRPCCRGNEGCISLFFSGCPIRCEVNPQAGREKEYQIEKVCEPKKIVIVGGGMAGMEAARVADLMGHHVTLFEKSDELGGHFVEATKPAFKVEGLRLLNWLIKQVQKSNVELRLNCEATPEKIKEINPDALIVAVGSSYITLPIPGIEHALSPDTVLRDISQTGDNVIVIGGGLIGSETALYLAQTDKKVSVIEMRPDIVMDDDPLSAAAIKLCLSEKNVDILTNATVTQITANSVYFKDENGDEKEMTGDSIVAATGLKACDQVVVGFSDLVEQTFVIGDCVKARKIFNCFHEAWFAVRNIR